MTEVWHCCILFNDFFFLHRKQHSFYFHGWCDTKSVALTFALSVGLHTVGTSYLNVIFKWVKFKGILLTIAILYIIMSVGYTVVKLSLLRHLQAACGILAFFCDPLWGCKDKEQKKYIYTFRTLIKRIKLIKLSGLEFNVYCISDHSGGHAARVCICVYTSL